GDKVDPALDLKAGMRVAFFSAPGSWCDEVVVSAGSVVPHKQQERTMKFGTIGAGAVALAFAREALAKGHEVVLSSRGGPHALAEKVAKLGRDASAASVKEASSLDYVLLAVPWPNVESALKGLPAWNGRVLIDATN